MKSDDLVFSKSCLRSFDGNVRLAELEPAGLASCVASCLALLIEALLLLPKGYATPRPPCAPDPAISSVQVRSLPKEEVSGAFLKRSAESLSGISRRK